MSGGPPVASTSGNGGAVEKDKDSLWYFTSEQLASSPSRRHGIDSDQELSYRQMTAYLIQEMGQRLQVSQLCINTAIVYMHRFYAFHSFTHFHRNGIAAASLFLAAKVEEQPRKLEHVIKAANKCLNQQTSSTTDAYYIEQAQDLVFNENVLLQTLGFDVAIDHPHTHVVKTCHLVKACKDLAQTSYFLASNSLHLTSMCLQYKPTVVACFCIYLACKWSRWEIPQSTEGKHWFHYVDRTVTMDLLKQLTDEFIAIYEKSPARLKSKLNSIKALAQGASNRAVGKDKKAPPDEWKMVDMMKMYHSSINTNDVNCTTSSVAQSISYANQAAAEAQAQQSVTPALLPPPPQQQQQQVRKSELHSSQHRSHHNSSSSNHTSHSKLGFPAAGDVPDHKHSSHKQQPFGGSFVNRAPQTSQMMSTTNQSRSNLSSSSSGRSALPSGLVAGGGQPAPRQTTQGHQLDVASYHKSRERGNLPVGPLAHGVVPSHTAGHQKMSQKQDSSRVISKDAPGRMADQAKQGSSNSSKLFASSSSMGGVAPYVGSQQPSGVQSNPKMDPPHDMQRNMIHNQRGGVYGGSSVPPPAVAPLGYHQAQPLSRQGSGSGGNNNKHDQNKSLSVHMQQQQQQQQQHHHKQNVPIDGQFGLGSAAAGHDLQQQHPQHQSHPYPPMRSSDILHSDDHSQQFSSGQAVLAQQAPPPQAKASMFSPDWSDKLQHPLMASSFNGSLTAAPGSDSYGFKMSSSSSTKDSPKRTERDRSAEVFIKKEKNRNSHPGGPDAAMAMPGRSGLQQLQMKPITGQKKVDMSANLNELAGTSTGASAGVKRPNESVVFKQEDDFLRDTKVRKLDNVPLGLAGYSDLNKLQVVNGIETNPDLVRSLLKESLCPPNALLKTEPLGAPSLQPPAELLEPTAVTISHKGNTEVLSAGAAQSSMTMEVSEGGGGGKAEKKKKKDKHKHKEKDKTKDREERKKHKKDKERHKDRESDTSEPVKLKLSKEKLEAAGVGGASEFKIKIAKERISGDLNSSAGLTQTMSGNDPTGPAAPTPALKIKISKDKLENYSSGASDSLGLPQASLNAHSSVSGFYSSFGAHNSVAGSTSSHSKKKDRDRDKDREREKKRSSQHDFIKATNGSGSGGGGGGVVAPIGAATGSSLPVHMSNASSKSQNSSKFKELL